jgi:hypothetical protein
MSDTVKMVNTEPSPTPAPARDSADFGHQPASASASGENNPPRGGSCVMSEPAPAPAPTASATANPPPNTTTNQG